MNTIKILPSSDITYRNIVPDERMGFPRTGALHVFSQAHGTTPRNAPDPEQPQVVIVFDCYHQVHNLIDGLERLEAEMRRRGIVCEECG